MTLAHSPCESYRRSAPAGRYYTTPSVYDRVQTSSVIVTRHFFRRALFERGAPDKALSKGYPSHATT
jgi:hypothetical protein